MSNQIVTFSLPTEYPPPEMQKAVPAGPRNGFANEYHCSDIDSDNSTSARPGARIGGAL